MRDEASEPVVRRASVPLAIVGADGRPRWKRIDEDVYEAAPELEKLYMAKQPGVPKQMPHVGHGWFGPDHRGIQNYLNKESYTMTDTLKAPFPWPGGKSDIAPAVWARLGQVENYVEPMCGTAAMLLARPGGAHVHRQE